MHKPRIFEQLVEMARQGTVRPVVAATFGLEEVPEAQGQLARRCSTWASSSSCRDRTSGPTRLAQAFSLAIFEIVRTQALCCVDGAPTRVELGEPEAGVEQVLAVLPGDHQHAVRRHDLAGDALVVPGPAQRRGRDPERAGQPDTSRPSSDSESRQLLRAPSPRATTRSSQSPLVVVPK